MEFSIWSEHQKTALEKNLRSYFGDEASNFHQACVYPIETGGKRIRPLFVFATMECFGYSVDTNAMTVASALELIHTYSLVHDDLPSMDNDDYRRGKPTVHKQYNEAVAVLVGDALLTKAFTICASLPQDVLARIIHSLGTAAGSVGMIGGQALDIGFEGSITNMEKLLLLHKRKTGALIKVAVEMAGILCHVSAEEEEALSTYGAHIGLAFQLADDVLDADEDAQDGGPPSFVKLLGIEETKRLATENMDKAIQAIAHLPHPQYLIDLAKLTVFRTF